MAGTPTTALPEDVPAAWVDAVYPVTLAHSIPWHDDAIRIMLAAAWPVIAAHERAEERSTIVADLHAEGERERERLREVYGLGPDDNPCHVSAAINNAILGWAFAARHVEGPQPQAAATIRNQPCTTCPPESENYRAR